MHRRGRRGRSALGVHDELLAHRLLVDARADVVLEDVRQRDQEVVHTLVLDQLLEKRLRLPAVVPPQELAHLIERDLPLEIHVHVFQQVPYELFHRRPPSGQAKLRSYAYTRPAPPYATAD